MNKILRVTVSYLVFHCMFIHPVRSEDLATYNQLNQAVVDLINAEVMVFHKEGSYFTCRYPLCAKHHRSTSSQVKVSALAANTLVYVKAEPKEETEQSVEHVLETAHDSALSESDIAIFLNLYEAKIQALLSDYRMSVREGICNRSMKPLDVCSFVAVTESYNKEGVERFSNELMRLRGVKRVRKHIIDTRMNSVRYKFQIDYEREHSEGDLKSIPYSIRKHPLRKLLETVKEKELKSYKKTKSFRSCTARNIMSPGVEHTCEVLYGVKLASNESLFVHGGTNLVVKLEKNEGESRIVFEYRQSGEKKSKADPKKQELSDETIRRKIELVHELPEKRVHIDEIERIGPQTVLLKGKAIGNQAIAWLMIYLRGAHETPELVSSRRISGKRFKQVFEIKVNLKK